MALLKCTCTNLCFIIFFLWILYTIYHFVSLYRTGFEQSNALPTPYTFSNFWCDEDIFNLTLKIKTNHSSSFLWKISGKTMLDIFEEKINISNPLSHSFLSISFNKLYDSPKFKHLANISTIIPFSRIISMKSSKNRYLLNSSYNNQSHNIEQQIYFLSYLPLYLVHDFSIYPRDNVPIDIIPHLKGDFYKTGFYQPPLYIDYNAILSHHWIPITSLQNNTLTIYLSYSPISFGWWRINLQLIQSLQIFDQYFQDNNDSINNQGDSIRYLFSSISPLIFLTVSCIGLLHLILDFLSIKHDIQWYTNRSSYEGISFNSLCVHIFFEIIILLYLKEQEANLLVIFSNCLYLLLNCYKIILIFYRHCNFRKMKFTLPSRQNDNTAFFYMIYLLIPLFIGTSIYTLIYFPHRSYYNWILYSFAFCMYIGGFLLMLPSVYLNYCLKSVESISLYSFLYRAFCTFIDDVMAFIFKIPTLHQIACFRDDIVFFIFLYQYWIYPSRKTNLKEHKE